MPRMTGIEKQSIFLVFEVFVVLALVTSQPQMSAAGLEEGRSG